MLGTAVLVLLLAATALQPSAGVPVSQDGAFIGWAGETYDPATAAIKAAAAAAAGAAAKAHSVSSPQAGMLTSRSSRNSLPAGANIECTCLVLTCCFFAGRQQKTEMVSCGASTSTKRSSIVWWPTQTLQLTSWGHTSQRLTLDWHTGCRTTTALSVPLTARNCVPPHDSLTLLDARPSPTHKQQTTGLRWCPGSLGRSFITTFCQMKRPNT